MKIPDIKTPRDVIVYWQECLTGLNSIPSEDVASRMVGVITNDYFDQLYDGADEDFSKLFELAASLEWQYKKHPDVRMQKWDEAKALLKRLEEKYVK